MRKVAYSPRYGGFGLSTEAVLLARKLSNNPKWGDVVLKGEKYAGGTISGSLLRFDSHDISGIKRHDPILIQVIETLGPEKASGRFADLQIAQVTHKYRIDEYDGNESVITPEDDKESYID